MSVNRFTHAAAIMVLAVAAFAGGTGTSDTAAANTTGPGTNTTGQSPPAVLQEGGTPPVDTPPGITGGTLTPA